MTERARARWARARSCRRDAHRAGRSPARGPCPALYGRETVGWGTQPQWWLAGKSSGKWLQNPAGGGGLEGYLGCGLTRTSGILSRSSSLSREKRKGQAPFLFSHRHPYVLLPSPRAQARAWTSVDVLNLLSRPSRPGQQIGAARLITNSRSRANY